MKFALSLFAAVSFPVGLLATSNTVTVNVTVPGAADVWLAGQPNATVLQGVFSLFDVAPANSPVLGSTGMNLSGGGIVTFSATGSTIYDPTLVPPNPCYGAPPDGTGCSAVSALSYFGISTYNGPLDSLIGVFIGAGTPGGTAPAGVNFTTGASQSQTTYSPLLNQVFFIGDGLTGNGTGTVQQFAIPAGATRLYLGSADGAGANYNNSGSFSVIVTGPAGTVTGPGGTPAAPAASTFVLVLTALLLVGVSGYWLKSRVPTV